LRLYLHAVANLGWRGVFFWAMAIPPARRHKDHADGADTPHKNSVMIGTTDKRFIGQLPLLSGGNGGSDNASVAAQSGIGVDNMKLMGDASVLGDLGSALTKFLDHLVAHPQLDITHINRHLHAAGNAVAGARVYFKDAHRGNSIAARLKTGSLLDL